MFNIPKFVQNTATVKLRNCDGVRCWVEGGSGAAGLGWTQSVSSFHSRGCHFILVSGLGPWGSLRCVYDREVPLLEENVLWPFHLF